MQVSLINGNEVPIDDNIPPTERSSQMAATVAPGDEEQAPATQRATTEQIRDAMAFQEAATDAPIIYCVLPVIAPVTHSPIELAGRTSDISSPSVPTTKNTAVPAAPWLLPLREYAKRASWIAGAALSAVVGLTTYGVLDHGRTTVIDEFTAKVEARDQKEKMLGELAIILNSEIKVAEQFAKIYYVQYDEPFWLKDQSIEGNTYTPTTGLLDNNPLVFSTPSEIDSKRLVDSRTVKIFQEGRIFYDYSNNGNFTWIARRQSDSPDPCYDTSKDSQHKPDHTCSFIAGHNSADALMDSMVIKGTMNVATGELQGAMMYPVLNTRFYGHVLLAPYTLGNTTNSYEINAVKDRETWKKINSLAKLYGQYWAYWEDIRQQRIGAISYSEWVCNPDNFQKDCHDCSPGAKRPAEWCQIAATKTDDKEQESFSVVDPYFKDLPTILVAGIGRTVCDTDVAPSEKRKCEIERARRAKGREIFQNHKNKQKK